jgi:light-regulated signal transduction histidine kinase (bacteriophytochrome)
MFQGNSFMNKEIVEEQVEKLQNALKERTAQLEATRQELEKFTYSVSHDLRAPLRAIEGFSKILLEDYAEKIDEEGQRYLNILDSSSRKMTRLLDDLLLLSRLSRQEMKPARINMSELVESTWQELQDKSSARKIDFIVHALPEGWGDAALLRRVWTNLISNAIKFTVFKEKAVIEISGETEPERVVYCIKDNGVGFNPSAATKLFGVFQRLHTEEEFHGSGMGLAIAQRLVRRHSGEIWGDAKKGEGAKFCFALPRVENGS